MLIKTLFFKLCDGCLVYNQRSKQLMIDCGVRADKIYCVYNSQDTDADNKVRETLHNTDLYKNLFSNDAPNLIFVGRVTEEKRLDMVVKALAIMKGKGMAVNFLVVGKEVGVDLMKVASEYDVETQVHLYGPCYDPAIIGEMFYNADVCVSPGNVGLTAISSLTFGCPVITHDNFSYQGPEFEAVVPGVTGDFFKQGDVNSLAEMIQKWISKEKQRERNEVRERAYAEVDSKWNIYSEAEVFKTIVSEKNKS